MRLIDTLAEYLAKYLKSQTAKLLAEWDGGIQSSEPDRIEVYCVLGWSDVTRAISAMQVIDREMRRGARAYRTAFGSGAPSESLFASSEWLLHNLREFPLPLHANQAGLDVVEASGPPFALHLTPTEEAFSALAHSAASQVGFTMAAFGVHFNVEWLTGRNLRPSDSNLASVVDFVLQRRTEFEVTMKTGHRADDLEETYYRSVSSPPANEHIGFEVHLVVQRFSKGQVDVIHAWY